jgi:lipooligosaccharide transport system permease protein
MLPMFLFSATFYPVTVYPGWLQGIVKALPLYQAVELVRGLTLGVLDPQMLNHVAYFVVMILLGLTFTTRRLRAMFLA